MKCMVCDSKKEVKKLSYIYTIGSEGTDLCLGCRVTVSKLLREMMALKERIKRR